MNEPDRDRRRGSTPRRCAVTAEHLNPLHERAVARERELDRRPRRGVGARALRALRLRPARRCTERRRRSSPRRDGLYRAQHRRGSCAAGSACAGSRTRAARPGPAVAGARVRRGFPTERALPALRATLAGLGIDLDAQRERRARHRGPAGQAATRVLRADPRARPGRPRDPAAGRPGRLPGAVPRGRPHRALRRHAEPSSRPRTRLLGDNAVTEGFAFLFEHLLADPAWLARAARRRPARVPALHGALQALLRAPLRGQAGVRARAARRGAPLERPAGALRRAPLGRGRRRVPARRTTSRTSTAASTAPATCGPGRSRRSCATTCASRFGSDWFGGAGGRRAAARAVGLGQSLRADELLRELTGEPIRFDVLADEAGRRAPLSRLRAELRRVEVRGEAVQARHPAEVAHAGIADGDLAPEAGAEVEGAPRPRVARLGDATTRSSRRSTSSRPRRRAPAATSSGCLVEVISQTRCGYRRWPSRRISPQPAGGVERLPAASGVCSGASSTA